MKLNYLTLPQYAAKHGVTRGRVHQLLHLLPGATRLGPLWLIPAEAPYPVLSGKGGRPRSGKKVVDTPS